MSASTVLFRTQSDARLVALASAGHDRAFEAIVERYRRPLLRACRRILPEARAGDALQQALLAAAADPADEVERRALVRRTLVAVAALPDRQRDALLRTAIAGQGQDEVARDLGLSNTAVRQLVHRARSSVRTAATALVPWPLAAWLAAA